MKKVVHLLIFIFSIFSCSKANSNNSNIKKRRHNYFYNGYLKSKNICLGLLTLSNCFGTMDAYNDAIPKLIGPPFEIDDFSVTGGLDRISAFNNDNFVITYRRVGGEVFSKIFSFEDYNVTLLNEVNFDMGAFPAVAVLKNQNFSLVKLRNSIIRGNLFTSNASLIPNSNFISPLIVPRIIPLSDGGFAITSSFSQLSSFLKVAIFDAFANIIQEYNVPLNDSIPIEQEPYPAFVTVELTNNKLATVYRSSIKNTKFTVVGRLYDRISQELENEFEIFDVTNFTDFGFPNIIDGVALKNGNYVIIWSSSVTPTIILGAVIDENTIIKTFFIELPFNGFTNIGITNLTDDSFITIFRKENNQTFNIFGKRFDANGNNITRVFFIGVIMILLMLLLVQ